MINHLPYEVGAIVRCQKKLAVINGFGVRNDGYIYSLSHFDGDFQPKGKSAWHDHAELEILSKPTIASVNFLREYGDL